MPNDTTSGTVRNVSRTGTYTDDFLKSTGFE